MACKLQEETLNQYYTIGTSILSGSTMLLGIIMDAHGSRILRRVLQNNLKSLDFCFRKAKQDCRDDYVSVVDIDFYSHFLRSRRVVLGKAFTRSFL